MPISAGDRFEIANGHTDLRNRAVTSLHRHAVHILNNAETHPQHHIDAAMAVWANPSQYGPQITFAMLNDDFINKDSVEDITDDDIIGAAANQWPRLVMVNFPIVIQ